MEKIEVLNEYHELVYRGDCELLLENFNFNSELEFVLNKLSTKEIKKGIFVNDDGEKYLLTITTDYTDEDDINELNID